MLCRRIMLMCVVSSPAKQNTAAAAAAAVPPTPNARFSWTSNATTSRWRRCAACWRNVLRTNRASSKNRLTVLEWTNWKLLVSTTSFLFFPLIKFTPLVQCPFHPIRIELWLANSYMNIQQYTVSQYIAFYTILKTQKMQFTKYLE